MTTIGTEEYLKRKTLLLRLKAVRILSGEFDAKLWRLAFWLLVRHLQAENYSFSVSRERFTEKLQYSRPIFPDDIIHFDVEELVSILVDRQHGKWIFPQGTDPQRADPKLALGAKIYLD